MLEKERLQALLYARVFAWISIGCTRQDFGNGEATGGSLREDARGCPMPDTASSAMDLPEDTAEPICQVCGAFVKTY